MNQNLNDDGVMSSLLQSITSTASQLNQSEPIQPKKQIILETLSFDPIEELYQQSFILLVHTPFSQYCFKSRKSISDVLIYVNTIMKFGFVLLTVNDKDLKLLEGDLSDRQKNKRAIEILNSLIGELLTRKDLISKQRTIDLLGLSHLEVELKSNSSCLVPNKLMGFHICDQYLQATGIHVDDKVIAVALANQSNLQKFGKIWNLIEPELMGMFSLFQVQYQMDGGKFYEQIYEKQYNFKLFGVEYVRERNQYIVGTCQGLLIVYDRLVHNNKITIQEIKQIQLLTTPIYRCKLLRQNEIYIVTDQSVKIIDLECNIIGGGSLKGRLQDAWITSLHMHMDLLYLGHSNGGILIYSRSNNLTYINQIVFNNKQPIESISTHLNYLFPCTQYQVPVIKHQYSNQQFISNEVTAFQSPLKLLCFHVCNKSYIGVGVDGVIIQWCLESGKVNQAYKVCDQIVLCQLEGRRLYIVAADCMLHVVELDDV